jgi:hypothetical protein
MAMRTRLTLALGTGATILMLGGCNTTQKTIGMDDPYFGESVRYNAALQTINPDPVYPEGGMEPGSLGATSTAAINRLRTDQTAQRHRNEVNAAKVGSLSTTETTSGGGGPR